ncbi:MAG: hypothetical protein CMD88_02125 [Gammaproteobacteria bacterium]|nr:hypothetical protein [Gammaproteobacteria bacterium]
MLHQNNKITIQPKFDYKLLFKNFLKYNKYLSKKYLFSSGRMSLYYGISSLQKRLNIKKVLLPSLICEEIIPVFKMLGIEIIYYQLNENLEIDYNYIEKCVKEDNYFVFIINYFGYPSNWKKILELKSKYGFMIIEDNAHSLYGKYNEKKLGLFGDISFTSFRKILPLLTGSELKINIKHERIVLNKLTKFPSKDEFIYLFRNFKPSFLNPNIKKNNYTDKIDIEKCQMDYLSYKIYTNNIFDELYIESIRYKNFLYWKNFLINSDLKYFNFIKNKFCPYVFPCIAPTQQEKEYWINWGTKNNISIINWPKLPNSENYYIDNNQLKNIIFFPVNHHNDISLNANYYAYN